MPLLHTSTKTYSKSAMTLPTTWCR